MFFVYEDISNISHQVCKSKSIHFQLTMPLYQRHEKRPSVCSKTKENKGSSLAGEGLSGLYVDTEACGSSYEVIPWICH